MGGVYSPTLIFIRSDIMTLTNGIYIMGIDDVINNSEITEVDLTRIYGDNVESHLANASKKVYQIYHNSYRGLNQQRQVAFMDWWIEQDTTRQNIIRDAVIEYIRGALYSGIDLNIYISDKKAYSEHVIQTLRDGGLWFPQTINYEDEDIA
jgi:hypothetical protein